MTEKSGSGGWHRDWRGDLKYEPPGIPSPGDQEPRTPGIRAANWKIALRFVPLALLGLYLGFGWWQDWRRGTPEKPIPDEPVDYVLNLESEGRCLAAGPRVCSLQIGPPTAPLVEELSAHFTAQPYTITTDVLPALDPPRNAVDRHRRQLMSRPLIDAIREAFPSLAADPEVTIIAVTPYDLAYSDNPWLNFVFGSTEGGRLGVVSTYRMNGRNLGQGEDEAIQRQRAIKLVSKYVGTLYFKLGESPKPDSVLYGNIQGLSSLDAITNSELTPDEVEAGRAFQTRSPPTR